MEMNRGKIISAGSSGGHIHNMESLSDVQYDQQPAQGDTLMWIAGLWRPRASSGTVNILDIIDDAPLTAGDDWTVRIQKAIDIAGEGGSVFVPPGNYMISDGLTVAWNNFTLFGAGRASRIWVKDKLVDDTDMITVIDKDGFTLRDITLDANLEGNPGSFEAHPWTTCLQLKGGRRHVIDNVQAIGGNIEGLYLYSVYESVVTNVNCTNNGIFRKDASGLHLDTCFDMNVSNVVSCDNGFHGIILSTCERINLTNLVLNSNGFNGLMLQTGCSLINASNVQVNANFRGVYVRDYSDLCRFSNVVGLTNGTAAIQFDNATDMTLTGLVARDNEEYGIHLLGEYDGLIAGGLRFRGNTLGTVKVDYPDTASFIDTDAR